VDDPSPSRRLAEYDCPVCGSLLPLDDACQTRSQLGADRDVAPWGLVLYCPGCGHIAFDPDP
jgi:hypothetical protein